MNASKKLTLVMIIAALLTLGIISANAAVMDMDSTTATIRFTEGELA